MVKMNPGSTDEVSEKMNDCRGVKATKALTLLSIVQGAIFNFPIVD
jgi:hypothetical protein